MCRYSSLSVLLLRDKPEPGDRGHSMDESGLTGLCDRKYSSLEGVIQCEYFKYITFLSTSIMGNIRKDVEEMVGTLHRGSQTRLFLNIL